jgi:CO/xanthine dehydrogenase Mo-binding subunit
MQDGSLLVGYGMAAVTYTFYLPPCKARASIDRGGKAFVRSAATDIGTGTYTVMTLLAAEILGLPAEQVRFGLGDTEMPNSPQQGGVGTHRRAGKRRPFCVRQISSRHSLISSARMIVSPPRSWTTVGRQFLREIVLKEEWRLSKGVWKASAKRSNNLSLW